MNEKLSADKGSVLEEVLRAYFLRAGFFVIRGVPFRFADEDLTDVDLWLYERPTGSSRRVQICDIKYKQRPKAVERLFWTKGLVAALDVDDAYVATTDKRPSLQKLAKKLSLQLIDGNDLRRIQASQSILSSERISDEQLIEILKSIDKDFRNRALQDARVDVLSALSDGFGVSSAVRSLENFSQLAGVVVANRPGSNAARAAGRLSYLAAAIACISLDYVSVGAAFRPIEERREIILNAVRYGALSTEQGQQALKLALALAEKYSPGGKVASRSIERGLKEDLGKIPAEIIADQAVRLIKSDSLFAVARELEAACYSTNIPNFDGLSIAARSMLGALLDYGGTDRERFSKGWIYAEAESLPVSAGAGSVDGNQEEVTQQALFLSAADSEKKIQK